jgi:hypothetical protein
MTRPGKWAVISGLALLLSAALVPVVEGHLCDNVFRQPDKLIVKPELTNVIVKDTIAFKVYLQNNMDRGITQIRLGGQSPAFDVKVSPEVIELPQGALASFDVQLHTRPNAASGSYPLNFRLYAVKGQAEQEFKRFSLAGAVAYLVPRLVEKKPAQQADAQSKSDLIQIDGKADEPAWGKALAMSNFRSPDGKPANPQTVVLAVFDSQTLYFAASCIEPKPGAVSAGDTITFMLNPEGRPELYSVTLMGNGAFRASVHTNAGERNLAPGIVKARVAVAAAEWSAEVAVPWTVFGMDKPPKPGETWRLNILRQRAVDGVQASSWTPLPGGYGDVQSYGQLFFAPEP